MTLILPSEETIYPTKKSGEPHGTHFYFGIAILCWSGTASGSIEHSTLFASTGPSAKGFFPFRHSLIVISIPFLMMIKTIKYPYPNKPSICIYANKKEPTSSVMLVAGWGWGISGWVSFSHDDTELYRVVLFSHFDHRFSLGHLEGNHLFTHNGSKAHPFWRPSSWLLWMTIASSLAWLIDWLIDSTHSIHFLHSRLQCLHAPK